MPRDVFVVCPCAGICPSHFIRSEGDAYQQSSPSSSFVPSSSCAYGLETAPVSAFLLPSLSPSLSLPPFLLSSLASSDLPPLSPPPFFHLVFNLITTLLHSFVLSFHNRAPLLLPSLSPLSLCLIISPPPPNQPRSERGR
eukprot:510294-Hanusia_phi.AAC.1